MYAMHFVECVRNKSVILSSNNFSSFFIDPRLETTKYIGPEFIGKAKWYGGLIGSDGCIVSAIILILC